MTNDQITSFFQNAKLKTRIVKIDFKSRSSFVGLFIESKDAGELNAKNFWRVISESRIEEFIANKDLNLARIFNGSEFTKLSLPRN